MLEDDRAEQKQLVLDVQRILKRALGCSAVSQDREAVDVIGRAMEVLANFDSLSAEAKAEALAAESRGRDLRRSKLVEERWRSATQDDFDFSKPGSFAARYR